MTTLTQGLGAQGAQLRSAVSRFLRGAGETFAMLDAAIRVSSAIDRHEEPDAADLRRLGIQAIARPSR